MLKTLFFDFSENENEPSIQVIFTKESFDIIDEIKKTEPLFDYEKYVDIVVKKAIEESVKEYENQ